MSKANNPIKVLRTALGRVQKGWIQHHWHYRDAEGNNFVCLEGAIYGYCDANKHTVTEAQKIAAETCRRIIFEKTGRSEIPAFNDKDGRTQEEIEEVIKLAIIRLETSDGIDDDEFDDLLAHIEKKG